MVSVSTRRQQVAYARARGVSCRRACVLLSVARSSLHYESKMAVKDAPVVARMHVHSARYPRWGYRRVRILLGRDGIPGRAYRLWKKAGLQVSKKRRRRRLGASRPRPHPPTGPNQV
jgi:putative transposase